MRPRITPARRVRARPQRCARRPRAKAAGARRRPGRAARSRAGCQADAGPASASRPWRSARARARGGHAGPPPRTRSRARPCQVVSPVPAAWNTPAYAWPPSREHLLRDGQDRGSEIPGRGRAAPLVRDDAQRLVSPGGREHRAHEILAVGRIDPARAQHRHALPCREHRLLACELGAAIDAGGVRRVGFHVGRALQPVEDVIGADVDQRDAGARRRGGRAGRTVPVGARGGAPGRCSAASTAVQAAALTTRAGACAAKVSSRLSGRSKSKPGGRRARTRAPPCGASAVASCPAPPVTRIAAAC